MMANTMVEVSGEARARARRRRLLTVVGVLFLVGLVSGFGLAMAEEDDAGFMAGPIPGWVAILLSVVWLVAMIWGTLAYKRQADEHEIVVNLWAMAAAGSVILVGYPVWWLLWRGELVPEPSHQVLFCTLYVVMLAVYVWKKYR